MWNRRLSLLACIAAMLFGAPGFAATTTEAPITISTVAQPSEEAGIDREALRAAMQEAIESIDRKQVRRPVTIALAVITTTNAPSATCTISLLVADRKKGTILGTAAGSAHAASNSHGDQRANVARLALTHAVARVPDVILASR